MIAFLRAVSSRLDQCEVTHVQRSPINLQVARNQHGLFARTLMELGVQVEFLPPLPEHADGVFVEDTAVLLPEIAVVARPGAFSRQTEVESVALALTAYRPIRRIIAPAALDGGDVLLIGRKLFVGISGRTNLGAVSALAEMVSPFGYEVKPVEVRGCLHLKTACTFIPPRFLVINPAWADAKLFGDLDVIPVDEYEPFAANTLTLGGTTLIGAAFRKTDQRLRDAGIVTRRVDISELNKAEAGLTCLALILEQ